MQNVKLPVPQFTLYGLVPYDRSAKVRWLLTELGVPFENRWLNREKREHEGAEFLKLNPMGRIPVLGIDDHAMFESGAICAYLGDLFPKTDLAPAIHSVERAEYQQWLYFAASTLDTFQVRIMVIEDIPPGEVHQKKLSALQADLRDALFCLDRVLKKNSFLVGNRFTVADICVSYNLYWCKLWPELATIYEEFPSIDSFVERMKALPSAVAAKVFSYQE